MRLLDLLTADRCRVIRGLQTPEAAFRVLVPGAAPELLADLTSSLAFADLGNRTWAPHARVTGLPAPVVYALLLPEGLTRGPPGPRFCFVSLVPLEQPDVRLQLLSHLTWLASQESWSAEVLGAAGPGQLFGILTAHETAAQGGFICLSREEVFRELDTGPEGLSPAEAARRLTLVGPNALAAPKVEGPLTRFVRGLVSVFALLLWVAGALCFLPGVDMPPLGWAIFSVVVINALFSFWQERKAGRAVEALQHLIPHEARVHRGQTQSLSAADLVWGDVIDLEEGDLVPADARLIGAEDFRVDNASLTGESRPVYKTAEPLPGGHPTWFLWTELPNQVFAGTVVTSGSATAVVTGTAMGTEIGKVARLTQDVRRVPSPLQKEMGTLVNILTGVSMAIGLAFFFLGTLLGGLNPLTAFLFTIGITVANIPEGLLPTLSLSLAMGVQRLARRGVLVKDLAAVETLGSTQVICTDKTGTLTTNHIRVTRLWYAGAEQALAVDGGGRASELLLVAVLCNNARIDRVGEFPLGDPTEGALLALAVQAGLDPGTLRQSWTRLRHFPFDSVRKRMGVVVSSTDVGCRVLVKGAPLELLELCTTVLDGSVVRPRTTADTQTLRGQVDSLATEGLRTLGFASKSVIADQAAGLSREEAEEGLCFLGLTGMQDPPRAEVPAAIASCARAGIRLVVVTGDYGPTAAAIARQIGLTSDDQPGTHLSGRDLDRLDDSDLDRLLEPESGPLIFSRVDPSQKMRVVRRFKALGMVVAVTGDGVNDAAALKLADIGIAMGRNVSDVAREAAAMVVLDGSFASIVDAIAEGRTVYANIRRFVTYVLSSNVPELAPFLLFVVFHWPLALTVMQILAIDLGTDVVPALGLGVEAPEPGLMDKPPRSRKDHLVDLALVVRAYLWLGLGEAVLSAGAFLWGCLSRGWVLGTPLPRSGPAYTAATTLTLVGIVACQVGNVFACRTREASVFRVGLGANRLVLAGVAVEAALVGVLVYTPFFQDVFGLAPLGAGDWLFVASFPPLMLGIEELRKLVIRHRKPRR